MFTSAIETAAQYTRPIHTISRIWGSTSVIPGTATLFFVNADGWALTCKHVANQLGLADQLLQKFGAFKAERGKLPPGKKFHQSTRILERKYGYAKGTPVEMYNRLVDCVEGKLDLSAQLHPTLDIALIKFSGFSKLHVSGFPVLGRNGADLKQGKFLCRLGFPFPEFTDFEYDSAAECIRWTSSGRPTTPRFPIEGMVTRHLMTPEGIVGFELSTPGLRGQSGGPAFDCHGIVWGMQCATKHLDLDFDVDIEVLRNGLKRKVSDSAFLHVGHCIHVEALKEFMRTHKVQFTEAA